MYTFYEGVNPYTIGGKFMIFFIKLNWMNLSQHSILTIPDTYLYIALILCGLFIIYLFLEPVCSWLIIKGCRKTISYFISTLVMLVILMVFLIINENFQKQASDVLKVAFISFSVYGFILAVYHYVRTKVFIKRKKVY